MDCDGNVSVHVSNDSAVAFHGQSATAGSWIVTVNLDPGASTTFGALFKYQASVDGFVQGHLDGDPSFVNVGWHAARACPLPTTTTAPVDTTPQPIPTTAPGQVQMCNQPGSNPPLAVPCGDPLATTPYQPPTTAPEPPPAPSNPPETTTEPPHPILGPVAPVHGPPKTVATTAAPKPITSLPSTGNGTALGIGGSLTLLAGIALCVVGRRRRHT